MFFAIRRILNYGKQNAYIGPVRSGDFSASLSYSGPGLTAESLDLCISSVSSIVFLLI